MRYHVVTSCHADRGGKDVALVWLWFVTDKARLNGLRCASITAVALASCLASPLLWAQTALSSSDSFYQVELGAGPATVLVLHGGPGVAHGYLRPEWDALARRYRVVYYDQRGCGRSVRRGPYGWQQHVADLHGLVLRHRTSGPVVLAGSSWGSWLALLYAWKYPEHIAALVLSGTPPWPMPRERERLLTPWERDLSRQRPAFPEHLRNEWDDFQTAQRIYYEAVDKWMKAREDSLEAGLLEEPPVDSATSLLRASNIDPRIAARLGESCITASRAIYNSFRQGPTIQQLASVRVPTLVVRGSRPNAVGDGADSLLMVLPNARLVTLLGAGHDPWFDWPKSFFAHLERFLRVSLQH